MQFITDVRQKAAEFVSENATTLLTAGGVIGTVATGVVAWRGGYKSAQILEEAQAKKRVEAINQLPEEPDGDGEFVVMEEKDRLSKTEKAVLLVPQALPPVVFGGFTIASIIMSHRMSAQKAAALAAAYSIADRNLAEYKAKVAEKLTGPKKDALETEIAQDAVNSTPGYDRVVIVEGGEDVLCFDHATGRYFKSSPEKIRRAENKINTKIIQDGGASVSEFYDELGLPPTNWSDTTGWGIGEQMDLKFDYVDAPDGRPCLSINFRNMPSFNFDHPYS